MTPQEIGNRVSEKMGSAILGQVMDVKQPWVNVSHNKIVEVCQFVRDDELLKFDFLRSLAAVDYIAENEFELVYLLFSYTHRHEFKLKVRLPRTDPRVATVESVWPAANWYEREAFDLFGIEFNGHSDMRRLLLPDDWEGHPLRKDYKEKDEYRGVSTQREYLTGMPELPTHPSQKP